MSTTDPYGGHQHWHLGIELLSLDCLQARHWQNMGLRIAETRLGRVRKLAREQIARVTERGGVSVSFKTAVQAALGTAAADEIERWVHADLAVEPVNIASETLWHTAMLDLGHSMRRGERVSMRACTQDLTQSIDKLLAQYDQIVQVVGQLRAGARTDWDRRVLQSEGSDSLFELIELTLVVASVRRFWRNTSSKLSTEDQLELLQWVRDYAAARSIPEELVAFPRV